VKFKYIAVIGSGTMGTGISQVLAVSGYQVTVVNKSRESLEKCIATISSNLEKMVQKGKISFDEKEQVLNRIRATLDVKGAVENADLVLEAVTEDITVKKDVFQKVSLFAPEGSIIASNTSSLSITQLSKYVKKPERFLGIHFFNPAPIMKLVEIVRGQYTSDEYVKIAVEFIKTLDKIPVIIQKDVPGFIVNRILVPTIALAINDLQKWSKEDVDTVMHRDYGFPLGIIKLADFIGLDVVTYINENIGLIETPTLLKELVKNGRLGRKTGVGFYNWKTGSPKLDRGSGTYPGIRLISTMVSIATELVDLRVAEPQIVDMAFKLGTNVPKGPFELLEERGPVEILSTLDTLYKEFRSSVFNPKTFKERLETISW